MTSLIYSAIASLDGYIADEDGKFDWAAPDEEVHTFVNDLTRPVGTFLLGRRMYEVTGVLGGSSGLRRAAVVREGVRRDLAGRGQGRLFEDARGGADCQDSDRV